MTNPARTPHKFRPGARHRKHCEVCGLTKSARCHNDRRIHPKGKGKVVDEAK